MPPSVGGRRPSAVSCQFALTSRARDPQPQAPRKGEGQILAFSFPCLGPVFWLSPSPVWDPSGGGLGRGLEAVSDDLCEGCCELWSVVEGGCPPNLQAALGGEGLGLDVQVVEDLQVVGDEADRADQDLPRP